MNKEFDLQEIEAKASLGDTIVLYGLKGSDYSKVETEVIQIRFKNSGSLVNKYSYQKFLKFTPFEEITDENVNSFLVNKLYYGQTNESFMKVIDMFKELKKKQNEK